MVTEILLIKTILSKLQRNIYYQSSVPNAILSPSKMQGGGEEGKYGVRASNLWSFVFQGNVLS